jgi:uncharacterized coiled-coil DUF342 family protein
VREREGLIARISQIRRASAQNADRLAAVQAESDRTGEHGEVRALASRIAELETMVQGLQDSVHRESKRQSQRLADLETQIQPAALVRALSEDARQRGL